MSSRDHQRQRGERQLVSSVLPLFQQARVNVAFEMVDGDQRLLQRKSQRLCITDADQQRARQPWPLRNRERVDRFVGSTRFGQSLAYNWNNRRKCSREANSGTTPPYG